MEQTENAQTMLGVGKWIGRRQTFRLIQQFDEFGEAYFNLAQVMQITANAFRGIAGAIQDKYIVHKEEVIYICTENADRIIRVVEAIQKEAADAVVEVAHARLAAKVSPLNKRQMNLRLEATQARFDIWINDMKEMMCVTQATDHYHQLLFLLNDDFRPKLAKFLKTMEDATPYELRKK